MKHTKPLFVTSFSLLAAFIAWTVAALYVDVSPIGPDGSTVGLATFNNAVHSLTGVRLSVYTLTDRLSLIPTGICVGFGVLGLAQWIRRKHFLKTDADILILGGFYVITAAAFLFFEAFPVNFRPVLIDGVLESSYPSSTTLLVMCVMPTAAMQFYRRIRRPVIRRIAVAASIAFTVFMVTARLLSGVHWASDIVGGALLSASLVTAYAAVTRLPTPHL